MTPDGHERHVPLAGGLGDAVSEIRGDNTLVEWPRTPVTSVRNATFTPDDRAVPGPGMLAARCLVPSDTPAIIGG